MGYSQANYAHCVLFEGKIGNFSSSKFSKSGPAHIRRGRRSADRPHKGIEVELEVGYEKLIAHVSAIFLLPVFEKWVIFQCFSAIMHSIGTVQGGNTVLCDGKSRRWTTDGSVICCYPSKHRMA